MSEFITGLQNFIASSGIAQIFGGDWRVLIMIAIACVLLYLAIVKKFEPLLLLPIAFGMLLANLPLGGVMHKEYFTTDGVNFAEMIAHGGLIDWLYLGVKLGIYPPLIFLGVGAMTDFGPLIANPKSILLGAAAQLGIFLAFIGAMLLGGFFPEQFAEFDINGAASIGIIGGADGPTAIYLTKTLKPELLSMIAIAAYSYMALIPIIQPPIMKLMTTKKGTLHCHGTASSGIENGKNYFPNYDDIDCCIYYSRCSSFSWYTDARKPDERKRGSGPYLQNSPK